MPAEPLIAAARALGAAVDALRFAPPVTHVYNPLDYAWELHAAYLRLAGSAPGRVLFLGMNPGPFGMAQTGVPFGEVAAVRDWLALSGTVRRPAREHPRRPVEGLACKRSEVSGRRLWGLFAARFATPRRFFAGHLVFNYCPLVFMEESGRNRTPDQLPAREGAALQAVCDAHLRRVAEILAPARVVGVGRFAAQRAEAALGGLGLAFATIPHPSPANPAANRDWAGAATRALVEQGVWKAGAAR
jgi:single-strand selective monofunctional uracil DNA glycosylase